MDNSIYLSIRYSLTRIKQSTDALVLSAKLWIMEIEILLTLAYTFMELVLRNQELFKNFSSTLSAIKSHTGHMRQR